MIIEWDLRRYGDGGRIMRDETVVEVDVAKLDALWTVNRVDRESGISDRYERFGDWLQKGIPVRPPEVGLRGRLGREVVEFADGRHRFAYLRDHGLQRIPVVVKKYEEKRFREVMGEPSNSKALKRKLLR